MFSQMELCQLRGGSARLRGSQQAAREALLAAAIGERKARMLNQHESGTAAQREVYR